MTRFKFVGISFHDFIMKEEHTFRVVCEAQQLFGHPLSVYMDMLDDRFECVDVYYTPHGLVPVIEGRTNIPPVMKR